MEFKNFLQGDLFRKMLSLFALARHNNQYQTDDELAPINLYVFIYLIWRSKLHLS